MKLPKLDRKQWKDINKAIMKVAKHESIDDSPVRFDNGASWVMASTPPRNAFVDEDGEYRIDAMVYQNNPFLTRVPAQAQQSQVLMNNQQQAQLQQQVSDQERARNMMQQSTAAQQNVIGQLQSLQNQLNMQQQYTVSWDSTGIEQARFLQQEIAFRGRN